MKIEVIIETEDGYSVVIKGDKNYTGTAYFKWIKGEDEKTITFIDAATNPMGEEQKGGKAEYTFAELAEEARLNKYKIVTDEKYKTLSNDGGSHINIYYKVDFSDNTITKYEDKYVGLKGYQYKEKKVYDKKLELSTSEVLKATLDNLLEKKDIKEEDDYSPYVIKSAIKEKNIYNKESIKKLERILEFIENE